MSGEAVVTLRAVTVAYDRLVALEEVDLSVHAGEHVALVGPSGAGKSTLLRLCTAAVQPSAGEVEVFDQVLSRVTPRQLVAVRRRIGAVHQQLHLVGRLRVVHNVLAGRLGHWPWWRALLSLVHPLEVDAARAALARVGVVDTLLARTDSLSGGEQQRVALARVLVQQPELVLADEPVASLDPVRGEEVLRLLTGAVVGRTSTLLVSLHDLDLALRHCDRVVGLRQGRVLFDLPPAEVTEDLRRQLYALEPT